MKAATTVFNPIHAFYKISIHAAREGGDFVSLFDARMPAIISIHAAREGGDIQSYAYSVKNKISIHAAREGGDCGNE